MYHHTSNDDDDADADENIGADASVDSVTSCSHGDRVVSETDNQPSDVDIHQPVTPSTAATASALLLTRQLVCSPLIHSLCFCHIRCFDVAGTSEFIDNEGRLGWFGHIDCSTVEVEGLKQTVSHR